MCGEFLGRGLVRPWRPYDSRYFDCKRRRGDKIKARLTNTTIVRSRVAKSELTFSMPTFAKMAVIAANAADNRAQNVQEEKKPEPISLHL